VTLLLIHAACGPANKPAPGVRGQFMTTLAQLNDGACADGQKYVQEDLREPTKITPVGTAPDGRGGSIETELVVALRKRCVPVWSATANEWQMQTLTLRTYGFPKDLQKPITEADANDPNSPNIAWSAPGPTFVMHPATKPGAADGTGFKMRLYNRMPFLDNDHACVPNLKCNTKGPNAGLDPLTGKCKVPPDPAQGGFPAQTPGQTVNGKLVEPPNCFHGLNSTNFHFHGFHVSPQLHQDNVSLELRPPLPPGKKESDMAHGSHGDQATVAYGHYDFNLDPLRYTQAPGTHWYHAHKHGSTALHVLNGQVGTTEVRGKFDADLEEYFAKNGGGKLADRLMVVQQLQERPPGLGGADQTGAVLVNGQGNPRVRMKRGEIQRWRFVGATMQASASLRIGFPDMPGKPRPEVRQIAMDGVQFSPDNYVCQPMLNLPDCTPPPNDSSFDELTAFQLAPGNRVDILVKAPDTAGTHCLVLDVTAQLAEANKAREGHKARAATAVGTCGVSNGLGPLFTLVVEDASQPMTFPTKAQFPVMPTFLRDIPAVTSSALQRSINYEMVGQGNLAGSGAQAGSQFWINQTKYDPSCAAETLTIDVPEQWTLRNNSYGVAHPFHIHQNPFQLQFQSDRNAGNHGTYKFPVWRDVLAIPVAPNPGKVKAAATTPNSNPDDPKDPWGKAVILYVAKEFTGGFVNHCHILGHEDRGMMHNTQAVCPSGGFASTGPVPAGAKCDADGFCPSDCVAGKPMPALPVCPAPPSQQSNWPSAYGFPPTAKPAK
jgi:FtsP/CotA-like multicopper oxidase with cupredoxin domain